MAQAPRDNNSVTTLLGVSSADGTTPVTIYVDPTTHRVLTQASGASTPGGSDTQVQFNDAGTLAGDAGFVYNKTTDTATIGNLVLTNALPVAQGGTGSTTAAAARTALGLVIGTNVQAWDADLDTWATKTPPSGTVVGTSDSQALTNKTYEGLTITASTGTLTIANLKTLTVSNTLTFTGTDASSVAFGAGGTVAYTGNNLSVFAATTSAQLAGVISDETGSGALVFATSPTLVTPVLGAATATTINGLTITSTTGTLTITSGKTLSASNTLTFAGTDGTTMTFPGATDTVMGLGATQTVTAAKTFNSATLVATRPKFVTSVDDTNGNELFGITATGSAVNEVTIANAATGNAPKLSATGGDTNIDLQLDSKGTGVIKPQHAVVNKVSALTDGANIATDASLGNIFTVTLAGNRTLDNPTNPVDGQVIIYILKQDGTGSRTITFGAAFRGSTDVALPTLTTTANAADILMFIYRSTPAKWDCLAVNKGFAS